MIRHESPIPDHLFERKFIAHPKTTFKHRDANVVKAQYTNISVLPKETRHQCLNTLSIFGIRHACSSIKSRMWGDYFRDLAGAKSAAQVG
jgi:hypothetical protein